MSNVSFEDFATEFVNELKVADDAYLRVPLKDIRQYDSMGKIVVSLIIERLFGFQIAYEVLDQEEATLTSLYQFCAKQSMEA